MANMDTPDKLNEWKNKFFELTEKLEKQKEYEELLSKSLSRLAVVSQGIDNQLDKHLASLRKLMRSAHPNTTTLEEILVKIEKTLQKLDEKKSSSHKEIDIIIHLIKSITWPAGEQKTIDKLLKLTDKKDIDELIEQFIALTEKSFVAPSNPPQKTTSFFSKLFSSKETDTQPDRKVREENVVKHPVTTEQDVLPPHEIFVALLEKLSLPKAVSEKAKDLRHSMQKGISISDIPSIINKIADLVSEIGSSAAAEKKEYEAFLKDLTTKISTLDQHISQFSKEDNIAFEQRQQLNVHVEAEMQSLKDDVADASELSELKLSINTRIDKLNNHLNSYHKVDHERHIQSQKQIESLTQRLKSMEDEAMSLREATQKARNQALQDTLTGIWNRQALNESLEREFIRWQRYHMPLSLVIWDIDFFKKVNDEYGHNAGDKVLKSVASIIDKATRRSDFIARFGGEEFVGLFPETGLEECLTLAEKVRTTIEKKRFLYEGLEVPITISSGIATFEEGDTTEDVFNRADKALYEAKKRGRNNCQTSLKF